VSIKKLDYNKDEAFVQAKVLGFYRQLFYAFFKKASDKMLLVRFRINYKIELIRPNILSYSLFYRITTEKLFIVKKYLLENLNKSFIAKSQAFFAFLVFFVKKPDKSLRFCIDYRKLNSITRKNQYLLFLIDETFARLAKAKIYTKLDIR
jgi:hypothetical protein